jgi:hypothetical protein
VPGDGEEVRKTESKWLWLFSLCMSVVTLVSYGDATFRTKPGEFVAGMLAIGCSLLCCWMLTDGN